jgi:hypothetical protein
MEWMLQAVYGYSITSVNMGKWLPIIIDRLAEWTVGYRLPDEWIATVVASFWFFGDMEHDRQSIMEAEWRVGANVLHRNSAVPSPNPGGDSLA